MPQQYQASAREERGSSGVRSGRILTRPLDKYIKAAIKSGPIPKVRDWRSIEDLDQLTRAERVMAFAEHFLKVPGGMKAGQPLRLELFQEAFLYSVFDNPAGTHEAVLSVARRNSKTFINAIILLAYLVGPLARENSVVASAANSRDQAALIAREMMNMIFMSEVLNEQTRVVPSSKHIRGLKKNTEYFAMSADAKTGYGKSLLVVILDEAGQIQGPETPYVSMLRSSQGSYDDPLFITISTQAASDADYLSTLMDDAIVNNDSHTVCHLYTTPESYDILDEEGWKYSNPGLDVFRSRSDLKKQLEKAKRIPSRQASVENLLLNRRTALEQRWLAPSVWKENGGAVDHDLFTRAKVSVGIDLSSTLDLTAAVFASEEDGVVHLNPLVFTPMSSLEDRAEKDKAPYSEWVAQGSLIAVPGRHVEYEWVTQFLADYCREHDIVVDIVAFDRWRIKDFQKEAEKNNFAQAAGWIDVGQNFKDMSPRIEYFESLLLNNRIRHGLHPLLNMAAASMVTIKDSSGNRKIDKSSPLKRIDAGIAAIMAVYALKEEGENPFEVDAIIG